MKTFTLPVPRSKSAVIVSPIRCSAATNPQKGERDILKLSTLLENESKNTWIIGDLLVKCIDVHDYGLFEVAKKIDQCKTYLSRLYRTAKAFPSDKRDKTISWYLHEICRSAVEKAQREIIKFGGNHILDFQESLQQMMKGVNKKGKPIRDPKSANGFFINQARKELIPPPDDGKIEAMKANGLINNCHNVDCRTLIKQFAKGSIQIANLDPPYANYDKTENAILDKSTSVALTDADGDNAEDSVQYPCDIIAAMPRLLKPNGVILLWQASNNYLRIPIAQAIEDAGLKCYMQVFWNKGIPQQGDPARAWTLSTETLYVIARDGEPPLNYDNNLYRTNVLNFNSISQKSTSLIPRHIYEKPINMMEFLVQKHSREGDLVADMFGCSGSCCIAAHNNKRNWVYCESNVINFEFGRNNIVNAI